MAPCQGLFAAGTILRRAAIAAEIFLALETTTNAYASFTEALVALTARSGKAIAVAIAIRAELPFADRTGANGVTTTADDHVAHVALGFTVEGGLG